MVKLFKLDREDFYIFDMSTNLLICVFAIYILTCGTLLVCSILCNFYNLITNTTKYKIILPLYHVYQYDIIIIIMNKI